MSRTRRRAYTGSKAIDGTCRNQGSCPYCARGRAHKTKRQQPIEECLRDAARLLNAMPVPCKNRYLYKDGKLYGPS